MGLASSRGGPSEVCRCCRQHASLLPDRGRPVAWSNSSTIFTAHPTQPIIIGRLFPSSKQFLVVSPDPILRSPLSYGPPTVISVSPNDHWLFAFFPSHESDGIACIWNRGSCVDAWIVKEYWPFSRGAGVITCAWAGTEREVRRLIFSVQTRLSFIWNSGQPLQMVHRFVSHLGVRLHRCRIQLSYS